MFWRLAVLWPCAHALLAPPRRAARRATHISATMLEIVSSPSALFAPPPPPPSLLLSQGSTLFAFMTSDGTLSNVLLSLMAFFGVYLAATGLFRPDVNDEFNAKLDAMIEKDTTKPVNRVNGGKTIQKTTTTSLDEDPDA